MKRKRKGVQFWNSEYAKSGTFALSHEPSEDLEKFCRFLERDYGRKYLNPLCQAVDLGCGNGRNLIYLSEHFGFKGYGVDSAKEAIAQARTHTQEKELPLTFAVGSIKDPLPLKDKTQAIVMDAMVSHILKSVEREAILAEILRVLRPDGWYFFKTFLLNGDDHAARLLAEHPGSEPHSYIHPEIGVEEHVFSEQELHDLLEPNFIVHKVHKSHGHMKNGRAFRRRSVTVYAQKR